MMAFQDGGPLAGTGSDGVVNVSAREPDVGTLDLLDFQLLNQRLGRDPLPYPFMLTRRSGFEFAHQVDAYAATLPERLGRGDLSRFARCLDVLRNADITVVGHVQYIPATTPSIRLRACRAGQSGFLLSQQADADAVDVSTVSPYELGNVLAAAMSLDKPGEHPRIIIPDYVPSATAVADDDAVVVRRSAVPATQEVRLPASGMRAYARIQSNWQPSREWGIDGRKESLVWVRFDDGDYLCEPEDWRAAPVTEKDLARRIDALIEDDVQAWRESKEDQ